MSAIRLPLLYAFAGGCLSNVVLFGLWRVAEGGGDAAVTQQHRSQHVAELVTVASAAPGAQPSDLVVATATGQAQVAAPTPAASDLDNGGPKPEGSAVSEVLTRLEAAYRDGVAARAPAPPTQTQERPSAAASADSVVAAAEAPSIPVQPVAEVIPAVAVAEPRAVAPAALPPAAFPPAALPPQVSALPAVATQDAAPSVEIHYGDVNQNTYITNVRQGDVYLMQVQQQVAMLQYMQLLGMSPGMAAPARRVGGGTHQRGALSSGITNPDNPWGFQFAPPNLVR